MRSPASGTAEYFEFILLPLFDLDGLNNVFGFGAFQIDMQQTVFHGRTAHIDPVGQNERPLELSRGNAPMQEHTIPVVIRLPPANDQLPVLDGDRQIILAEARHGQRDAIAAFGCLFDVKGGISLIPGFRAAFQQAFQLFKPQEIGVRSKCQFRHLRKPLLKRPEESGPCDGGPCQKYGDCCRSCKGCLPARPLNRYIKGLIGNESGNEDMNIASEMNSEDVLRVKLEVLRREHRDLDDAIRALEDKNGAADQFTIRRLKKQKLVLKDRISAIEDTLLPDIIA